MRNVAIMSDHQAVVGRKWDPSVDDNSMMFE
jgi:hypothetical protein